MDMAALRHSSSYEMSFNFEKLLSNACVKNGNAEGIYPSSLGFVVSSLCEERVPKLESK